MNTILIGGVPFQYDEEVLSYQNIEPMTREDGIMLLNKVKQLFEAQNLDFYLAYGTLLGAVREKDFIKGDEDVDVFIHDENKLLSLLPYLKNEGLFLVRAQKKNVYSFRLGNNAYIDVYVLRKIEWYKPWSLYCYSIANKSYTPKRFFREYQDIEFLGSMFKCPKNPELWLEFMYGKDWRTPVRGHTFYYEVLSHWFLRKKIIPIIVRLLHYKKRN